MKACILHAREQLQSVGASAPAFECQQLLCRVLGIRRELLPLQAERVLTDAQYGLLESLLARRAAGEPLQYLLGEWEFYGLPFEVGEGVLIPRADTELLVERALSHAPGKRPCEVLDLCSGSGCVAVALAKTLPGAQVTAVELSPVAYGYLERNIARNHAAVLALREDILTWEPKRTYDLITANPPYIPSAVLPTLQREVQQEPATALDGGADGLDFYRCICGRYPACLAPGGWLLCEIGCDQGEAVRALFEAAGLEQVAVHRDLAGNDRVVEGRRPPQAETKQ